MDKHIDILTLVLSKYWNARTKPKIISSWESSNKDEQQALYKWYVIRLLKD